MIRRFGLLVALAFAVNGCGTSSVSPQNAAELPFVGGTVADDPVAALAGQEVLRHGGFAGDAALVMLATQAVTLPTSAGFGGGGVCLVWRRDRQAAEMIDFSPRPTAGGSMSVPGLARGMAALHARHGTQRWEELLAGPEKLARFGTPIGRALALEMGRGGYALDERATALLTDASGRMLPVGAKLVQLDLASLIGRLRALGAGDFYAGQTARALVEAAQASGGDLSLDDLRKFVPGVAPADQVAFYDSMVAVPPGAGGRIIADLVARLQQGRYASLTPPERPALVAAASAAAYGAEAARRPQPIGDADGPTGAGIAVVDVQGNAVSCAVTQGGRFGNGRLMGGSGLFMAPPPPRGGALSLAPLLLANSRSGRFYAAIADGEGLGAPVAATITLFATFTEGLTLEAAYGRPRYFGLAGGIRVEDPESDSGRVLATRGAKLEPGGAIGRDSALVCRSGIPFDPVQCEARADPRGAGFAAIN